MPSPILVTPPVVSPVTLAEAKAALDISYSEKDVEIQGLIDGVTAWLDGWNGTLGGRCLCEQTWREEFEAFSNCMRLELLPILSATITYKDSAGQDQTIDAANYVIREDEKGAYVEFVSGFSAPTMSSEVARPLSIQYVAGYEADSDERPLPKNIKTGILLLVRMLFDNPSGMVVGASVESLPFGPKSLLMPAVRMRV